MSDLTVDDIEAEALRLVESVGKPTRRVRPRLARKLQEAEDRQIDAPGGPVMAWRLGVGPATLMVHGWEDDNALWSPLIDECATMLRAAVTFDLPGHGWSPAEDCSIENAGKAILAVAEAMGPIDSVVAHSFGCGATIWALAHGLKVPRAVLIASPVPGTRRRSWEPSQWEKKQIENGEEPEVVARALELIAQRPEPPQKETNDYSVESVVPTMTAKGLMIHSMDDDACPVSNSQTLTDLWPDASLILVDELGHRLVAQDADIVTQIFDFVESSYAS